jgi:DNA modification methylase
MGEVVGECGMTWKFMQGDALEQLRKLPDESVNCCVTSPPYWGLRDYGVDDFIYRYV